MSIIVDTVKSEPGQISRVELKKWLINAAKFFGGVVVVAFYEYMKQVATGVDFSMKNLGIAILSALAASLIDITHRFANDNTQPVKPL